MFDCDWLCFDWFGPALDWSDTARDACPAGDATSGVQFMLAGIIPMGAIFLESYVTLPWHVMVRFGKWVRMLCSSWFRIWRPTLLWFWFKLIETTWIVLLLFYYCFITFNFFLAGRHIGGIDVHRQRRLSLHHCHATLRPRCRLRVQRYCPHTLVLGARVVLCMLLVVHAKTAFIYFFEFSNILVYSMYRYRSMSLYSKRFLIPCIYFFVLNSF